MSETLFNTFAEKKNQCNSSSNSNSNSTQINELSPKPSCSKDLTNIDNGIKPCNLNYEEKNIPITLESIPTLPDRICENRLNNYSDYEIYDQNNNFMLTNLNDFGLTYFNINEDNENVNDYSNNEVNLDSTTNDVDIIFKRFTDFFYNKNTKEAKLEEIVTNEDINVLNLEEIKKQAIDKEGEENIKIPKYFDESPELLNFVRDDIEQVLKCNLISKVCDANIVYEISDDEDNNLNDNKFPQTVGEVLNKDIKNITFHDNINLVNIESKDCLLANDREINYTNNNNENHSDDSDTCGYHSSDFEFIDEEEARKECKLNIGPIDIAKSIDENTKGYDNSYIINDYFFGPTPINDTTIPTGDNYDNLFLAQSGSYPCINIEYKAVTSIKGMEVSPGPVIDLNCLLKEDDKYKAEADESIQIILSMYPNENSRVHTQKSK